MTVTVEVKNQRTLDLLKAIEELGLIHVNSPKQSQPNEKTAQEEIPPYHWLQGIHKGMGGSVENFLTHCHEDKEHEIEIEKRQEEERARYAGIHS